MEVARGGKVEKRGVREGRRTGLEGWTSSLGRYVSGSEDARKPLEKEKVDDELKSSPDIQYFRGKLKELLNVQSSLEGWNASKFAIATAMILSIRHQASYTRTGAPCGFHSHPMLRRYARCVRRI